MSRRPAAVLAALLLAALVLAPPAGAAPPSLRARSAILVQPDTGDLIYARAPDQRRPIASTTKLMTALLTLERTNLDDVVPAAPYHAQPAESVAGLRAGERLTVRDLLRALLLQSANDAAVTLAVDVAGSRTAFVRAMNARAGQLHLRNTHYANPVGLDERGNYSSARDLVALAQVLLRNRFFARTVDRPRATLTSGARVRRIVNRNLLVRRVPFVDGVKTGHTAQAGYVLIGAGERRGVRLASAVLGDPSEAARDDDTLTLLRYGLGRYRAPLTVRRGAVLARPRLKYRDGHVDLVAARSLRVVRRRGERVEVRVTGAPDELDGPLPAGARVGAAVVVRRGRTVGRVPLVTRTPVPEASLGERVTGFFGSPLTLVLVAVLA
ncbi:MAG TPA: D-alanyl-D-alanine carboxypeptidase family protein, partial [Solirubrobacteraceae bacterium]